MNSTTSFSTEQITITIIHTRFTTS